MKKEFIGVWLKSRIIRNRQRDIEKIISMINSAEINAKVTKSIKLNNDTATLIFREIYESVRQLADAKWWLLGYEPLNHEISLEALKDFDIKDKLKLNSLDRFKKTRHDVNYRGFRATIQQAEEILDFWDKCGGEIIKKLRDEIGEANPRENHKV
ncbi:MAG TPA: hypothetical protein HA282_04605 [Nanoarchaeota archaeon]|nr:hypothetical protein [Candidatus Pacearchaeota archaeon]HIH17748.1 hypothetical protein [Nanoarchaeota archaeon]HIH33773.1 hypothetical protein [Nanoarchaeota archaeon]HIH50815.1 hypothetical protein [Nanoarchaeota archaeon]HIH66465.1 hypothetical protein [Nanoarchaeota archaeon]